MSITGLVLFDYLTCENFPLHVVRSNRDMIQRSIRSRVDYLTYNEMGDPPFVN